MPVSLRKLERMLVDSIRNALRLHSDSILLYRHKSYPSANLLSLLALEEVGKGHILDDFIWHSMVEGRYEEKEERVWLESTFLHTDKQRWFASQSVAPLPRRFMNAVYSGALEALKQRSVYVGFGRIKRVIDPGGKIRSPFEITREQAEKQITLLNDYFLVLILGKVVGAYEVDSPNVAALLDRRLYSRLLRWPRQSKAASRLLSQLSRH